MIPKPSKELFEEFHGAHSELPNLNQRTSWAGNPNQADTSLTLDPDDHYNKDQQDEIVVFGDSGLGAQDGDDSSLMNSKLLTMLEDTPRTTPTPLSHPKGSIAQPGQHKLGPVLSAVTTRQKVMPLKGRHIGLAEEPTAETKNSLKKAHINSSPAQQLQDEINQIMSKPSTKSKLATEGLARKNTMNSKRSSCIVREKAKFQTPNLGPVHLQAKAEMMDDEKSASDSDVGEEESADNYESEEASDQNKVNVGPPNFDECTPHTDKSCRGSVRVANVETHKIKKASTMSSKRPSMKENKDKETQSGNANDKVERFSRKDSVDSKKSGYSKRSKKSRGIGGKAPLIQVNPPGGYLGIKKPSTLADLLTKIVPKDEEKEPIKDPLSRKMAGARLDMHSGADKKTEGSVQSVQGPSKNFPISISAIQLQEEFGGSNPSNSPNKIQGIPDKILEMMNNQIDSTGLKEQMASRLNVRQDFTHTPSSDGKGSPRRHPIKSSQKGFSTNAEQASVEFKQKEDRSKGEVDGKFSIDENLCTISIEEARNMSDDLDMSNFNLRQRSGDSSHLQDLTMNPVVKPGGSSRHNPLPNQQQLLNVPNVPKLDFHGSADRSDNKGTESDRIYLNNLHDDESTPDIEDQNSGSGGLEDLDKESPNRPLETHAQLKKSNSGVDNQTPRNPDKKSQVGPLKLLGKTHRVLPKAPPKTERGYKISTLSQILSSNNTDGKEGH